MMSPGKIAQPPQPIGSFQPTKVSPLTDAGAAMPEHQSGNPVASTPVLSRITPSVTSACTPRLTMRMHRMSPKMPAFCTPIASATAMQPSGMSSIAARVEIGLLQLSGVARSSRTGTKRKRESRADDPLAAGHERHRALHPGVPDAFLQQHRGDGAGRDVLQDFKRAHEQLQK